MEVSLTKKGVAYMQLNVLENKKEKLKVEVKGESYTLAGPLVANLWELGAKQANFIKEHSYMSDLKVVVYDKNPKKKLIAAAEKIIDDAKDFQTEFKRALEK